MTVLRSMHHTILNPWPTKKSMKYMKSVVVLSVITSCLVHRVCNENADDQSHPETLSDAELQKLFNDTSLDDADFTLDCTSPPEVGPCKALMQNFYFDTETNECKTFTYGGCYGNDNRYETAEGCKAACKLPENLDENHH